jgi:methylglutamate dehydrogenase subunit D
VAVRGSTILTRVGPGRVWVIDDRGDRPVETIAADIGSATSLDQGRFRARLSGFQAPLVMSRLVALDLDSPALSVGRAATTAMHHVPVLLHRLGDAVFDLYGPRTFSTALIELAEDAASDLQGTGWASTTAPV